MATEDTAAATSNTASLDSVLSTITSNVPFAGQILDIQTAIYNKTAPTFVRDLVDKQAKPLLNTYCEYVIIPAATLPSTAYTYVVKVANETLDVVLPPVSKEAREALSNVSTLPSKVTERVNALNTDLRNVLAAFNTKVENAKSSSSDEASVFRILNDLLVVLQTTPLAPVTTKLPLVPQVTLPAENFSTTEAVKALLKDSQLYARVLVDSLVQRYSITRGQLADLIHQQLAAFTTRTSPAAAAHSSTAEAQK